MVLVDTSVWVEFFRKGHRTLDNLLSEDRVAVHPIIISELACGHLTDRFEILSLLLSLPHAKPVIFEEVLNTIELNELYGSGLGYCDVTLITSTLISGFDLLTLDKKMSRAYRKISKTI
ncbi:MAG: PIN domain-containing protein [Halobacteriovoraceae bacterium]|nr:PIN domain-containing protein [Halobacteriovoraceae bacterium]